MLGIIFCLLFLAMGFWLPNMAVESRNWFFFISALFYIGSRLGRRRINYWKEVRKKEGGEVCEGR